MKNIPTVLTTYLQNTNVRGTLILVDLYTITLKNGTILRYANSQFNVTIGGTTWTGGSVIFDGFKGKLQVGLETDSQQVTMSWRPYNADHPVTVGNYVLATALRLGFFDWAKVVRYRTVLPSWNGTPIGLGATCPDGSTYPGYIIAFSGRVGVIEQITPMDCKLNIQSDLIVLKNDMPRNLYQKPCLNTLYDSVCTLNSATYTHSGTVTGTSTNILVNWSGCTADIYSFGTVTFTSGLNINTTAFVLNSTSSGFTLSYPLPFAALVGDTFTIIQGCDKTQATCKNRYNNLVHNRSYPAVPPPEAAY